MRIMDWSSEVCSSDLLADMPPPSRPVAIAVYGFSDQTGQFKPSETGQTLSRAVSQGGASILVKALQDAGNRQWFTIVEREMLRHLLRSEEHTSELQSLMRISYADSCLQQLHVDKIQTVIQH